MLEPELDDEFAKDVSEFETLKELRADLGDKLAKRREQQARTAFEENLLDQVVENMTVEVPQAMVDQRAQNMMEDYAQRITSQGIPFEQYLAMTGMTVDMLKKQAAEGALRQVKVELAMGAIAAEEKIEVTQEDLDAECARLGEQYGMPTDKVKEIVPESELRKDLTNQKAAAVIFDSAKVGKAPAKKTAAKKAEGEEKPAAKATAKKTTAKTAEKKPAAKKTTTKKAAPKKTEE